MRHLLFISCIFVAITASAYSERYPMNGLLNGNAEFPPVLVEEANNNGMRSIDVNAMCNIVSSAKEDNNEPMSLDVKVEKAGDLKTVLGDNIYKVDILRIEGPINYDDYNTIWESTFHGKLKEVYLDKAEAETDLIPEQTFFHVDEQVDWSAGYIYTIRLEKIVLPKNIREIGRLAFGYSTALRDIQFPDCLKIIGEAAFTDCMSYSKTKFVLPPNLEVLGYQAFMNCRGLDGAEVVLPETIRVLDGGVFYWTRITKINIPENVEFIGMFTFAYSDLKEIYLPDSCMLGKNGRQFKGNWNLESAHLPAQCIYIPCSIFENCMELTNINIPQNTKFIGESAFMGCGKLNRIKFPEGLEDIDYDAFNGCKSIEELYFPSTIKTLGAKSFSACLGLKAIHCKAPIPPVCENDHPYDESATLGAFGNLSADIPIYIPVNSKSDYASAFGWDRFKNFNEIEFSGIERVGIENNAAENGIYDLNGRKLINPISNQLYIKRGKQFIYKE